MTSCACTWEDFECDECYVEAKNASGVYCVLVPSSALLRHSRLARSRTPPSARRPIRRRLRIRALARGGQATAIGSWRAMHAIKTRPVLTCLSVRRCSGTRAYAADSSSCCLSHTAAARKHDLA